MASGSLAIFFFFFRKCLSQWLQTLFKKYFQVLQQPAEKNSQYQNKLKQLELKGLFLKTYPLENFNLKVDYEVYWDH